MPFEDALFNELFPSNTAVATSAVHRSVASARRRARPGAESASISSVQRLAQLEASVGKLELELALKRRRVEQLRAELRSSDDVECIDSDECDADAAAAQQQQMDAARRANADLVERVQGSDLFLDGYDLRWVGGSASSPLVPLGEVAGAGSSRAGVEVVDIDQIVEWVQRLNYGCGGERGVAQLERASDGRSARITRRDEGDSALPLTVYADGLFLERGPFRPWSHPAVTAFVRAASRGVRPRFIAEDRFFVVTDRRDVRCADAAAEEGGRGPHSSAATSRIRTASGAGGRPLHELPMTQAELLRRLPTSVVRDGCVVDVRRVVAEHLAAGSDGRGVGDAARQRAERETVRSKRIAALERGSSSKT